MRRSRLRHALLTSAFSAALTLTLAAAPPPQRAAAARRHPNAATATSPVAADASSIAAGQAIYANDCANCHGDTGKGDGRMGEELNPQPSDLTDAEWKHGSTDGDIFKVIHDGAAKTGMKAYGRRLTEHQIWDVINYIRSIGPAPKSH